MKILQLAPQIPYPPIDGGRIGIYNITKYLSLRGHHIDFIAYRKNAASHDIDHMNSFCNVIPIDASVRNSVKGMLTNLVSSTPYNIEKFDTQNFRTVLQEYLRKNKPDVVHIDHLHLAWAIETIREFYQIPVILREHNVEMTIMERFAENHKNIFIKYFAKLQFRKFLKYEPDMCAKFSKCACITDEDVRRLLNLNPDIKTCSIPAGVDKTLIDAAWHNPAVPLSICHIGPLYWQPNLDGLEWFIGDILPSIIQNYPGTKLYVYSKGTELVRIPDQLKDNIILAGFVENLWKEISDKQIVIVPLRVGGGMRIKILELLANGKLIITTNVGKEGIPARHNEHLLVADSKEEFLTGISNVFESRIDTHSIGSNAQLLIKENYIWEKIAEQFEQLYLSAISDNL